MISTDTKRKVDVTARENVSLKGRHWSVMEPDLSISQELRAKGVTLHVANMLTARGITAESYAFFMDPKVGAQMPDPSFFLDMDVGAQRIARAITERQRIGIWSDYDVDGATSAAILGRFLRMCGHDDFVVRIPDRIKEGYGPNVAGMLDMKSGKGCDLVCVLDAGTVAFDPLIAAQAAGIEVIVIDHHAAEVTIPPAVAVINPNRKDQTPGYGHLCAAGMTFIFAIAVTRELKKADYFDVTAIMPDLMSLLDLVALGTVCDVVSLTGLNRAFVAKGIPYLTKRRSPGIAALADAAGLVPTSVITEKECGWVLGPRINAGGRIGDSASGSLLLLEEDRITAKDRGVALDEMNRERKELEAFATQSALEQMSARVPGVDRTLALAIVKAHEGVVGISASRVKDAYDCPAIVVTEAHDGTLKGSARSVKGFDIGHAIIDARRCDLIIKGGGHGMAGGLTLTRAQVPGFIAFMNEEIAKTDYWRDGLATLADVSLSLPELSVDLIDAFDSLRPFGTDNPEPVVIVRDLVVAEIRILKEKHFKIIFRCGGKEIDGLIWNVVGTSLGDAIQASIGRRVDVLAKPQINEFRGNRTPQIMLEDMRFVSGSMI